MHDYFAIDGDVRKIEDQSAFLELLGATARSCSKILYWPDSLESPYHPWRFRVRGISFSDVSFKQTTITDFEFTQCTFHGCLFISTIFRNCRFTSCRFVDCNPHRAEFEDCFLDPGSFADCIPERRYANVGVYIFQELLRNSRQQAQPDFTDQAQYYFRKWQRFQLREELRGSRPCFSRLRMRLRILGLLTFDMTTGSGTRLGRFAVTALLLLIAISMLNWVFACSFGLQGGGSVVGSFVEAFYFSTVVMTTVGFGDITPSTPLGRLVVSGEAVLGFFLFASLTSTMYRKLTS